MLDQKSILQGLQTRTFGKTVFSFDTIDSTNTFAKNVSANSSLHGALVIAEEQLAGRGRRERQWISSHGKNLLFSVILLPDVSPEKIALLPLAGSLAVADAVETVSGLSATCKWPNDVLINNKKVCGMLLESTSSAFGIEQVVLGIGINVNQEEFPDELHAKATSLKIETGKTIDRRILLQEILKEAELRYEQLISFPADRLLSDWKMKALLFGKQITVMEQQTPYSATAIDLAPDGSLIIETAEGTRKHLFAADVSLLYP